MGPLIEEKQLSFSNFAFVMLAILPDGTSAIGYRQGSLFLWSIDTGEIDHVLINNLDRSPTARFSRDGTRVIASLFDSGFILHSRVWSTQTGRQVATIDEYGVPALSPDSTQAMINNLLWDVETGEQVSGFKRDYTQEHAEFSADGRYILTLNRDGKVKVWLNPIQKN